MGNLCPTFFLALQWQQTVHRYLRVLHSRMIKRPPKKVTIEEARNAHHMRWPLLSQGTSGEKGMFTCILDMWIEDESGLKWFLFFGIILLPMSRDLLPSSIASIQKLWGVSASAPCPTAQPYCFNCRSLSSVFSSVFINRTGCSQQRTNFTSKNRLRLCLLPHSSTSGKLCLHMFIL